MSFDFFMRGLLIGLSIAAPVGPMSVLVIRRTLAESRRAGLISGLGIAAGDTTYGALGGFGLTFITGFLINEQFWLRLIGGLFLFYLGIKTLISRPAEKAAAASTGKGPLSYFLSTYLLTLTNPLTIISFAAIMAGLGIGGSSGDYFSATVLVLGVLVGSTSWWLILTTLISLFRARVTPAGMVWINRISGLIIVAFGLLALLSLVQH